MASRLCCAEDDRPDSPPLPNVRPSPVRTQQPIASASYTPPGAGTRSRGVCSSNVDGTRAIFENTTTDRNPLKQSSMGNPQDLYVSPRKAPVPPQRSVRQQLRIKFSQGGTNSGLTILNAAKRKIQSTKQTIQLLPLTLQKNSMLETLPSHRDTEDEAYDRDAAELNTSSKSTPRPNPPTPVLANEGHLHGDHHRSAVRSFEWMSPLFDGHHTVSSGGSPVAVNAESSDSRPPATSRLSPGSSDLLATSLKEGHTHRQSPVSSLQSEDLVHSHVPVLQARPVDPSTTRHCCFEHDPGQLTTSEGSNHPHEMACTSEKKARSPQPAEGQCLGNPSYHEQASHELVGKGNFNNNLSSGYPRKPSMATNISDRLTTNSVFSDTDKTSSDHDFLHRDVNGLPLIRCTSQESVGISLHLQDMQISQRLRSSSNVTDSASLTARRTSEKSHNSHTLSSFAYTTGAQLDNYSNHVYKSGFIGAQNSRSWSTTHRDVASSVFSSQPESNPASSIPYTLYLPDSLTLEPRTPTAKSPSFATAPSHADTPSQLGDNNQKNDSKCDGNSVKYLSSLSNVAGPPFFSQAQRSQASSSNLSRISKFVEDIDALGDAPKRQYMSHQPFARRKYSTFNLFHFSRSSARQLRSKVLTCDGPGDEPTDQPNQAPRSSIPLLQSHDEAAEMWERALKAHAEEKAAMWLKPDDHWGDLTSKRQRRHSDGRSRASSEAKSSHQAPASENPAVDSIDIDPFDHSKRSSLPQSYLAPPSPTYVTQGQKQAVSHAAGSGDHDLDRHSTELSAWCRYPSHTRTQRCGSAGPDDNVFPRDFVTPSNECARAGQSVSPSNSQCQTNQDPKRFKKRFSFGSRSGTSGRSYKRIKSSLPKTRSLTFGRRILKHYASFFKPQSHEFFHYGHGHRTSVSTGGALENPELEILRPVLSANTKNSAEASDGQAGHGFELSTIRPKGKTKAVDDLYESVSNGRSTNREGPATDPAQDIAIQNPVPTPSEKSSSSNMDGINCDDSSNLAGSAQLSHNREIRQKRKRYLPSSHSDPIVDYKASMTIKNIASAWSKVCEDCVDHALQSHSRKSDNMVAEEPTESPRTCTPVLHNVEENRPVQPGHDQIFSPGPTNVNASVTNSSPDPLRMRGIVKLLQPVEKQSCLLLPPRMDAEFNSRREMTARLQAKSPTLSSSASAPLIGTSEASFLEALNRNECLERERVLKQAEELLT